jgi:hypothetical protein
MSFPLLRIRRRHLRFIWVNGRMPCRRSLCTRCGKQIGASYLREIATRLPYRDPDCYADHCEGAVLALENHASASYASLAISRD